MFRIESMLSARLFLTPQVVGKRLYFISNLSGHLSLYAMDYGGSVPEPLLPPHIALQNPHLMDGESFYVFPGLGKILVMIDRDGDENYQPMLIPLEGGFPEPAFDNFFANFRAHLFFCDSERNVVYLSAESRSEQMNESFRGNLQTGGLVKLGAGAWGMYPVAINDDHSQVILADSYTMGDQVLYLKETPTPAMFSIAALPRRTPLHLPPSPKNGDRGRDSDRGGSQGEAKLLYGTPIEQRAEGQVVPLLGYRGGHITPGNRGLLLGTALFSDTCGLGYLPLAGPSSVKPVSVTGLAHRGMGEFTTLEHLTGNRYLLAYNIDGCSWLYEGLFDESALSMKVEAVICGQGTISNGVLEACHYDKANDRFALSFSTATSPTQIYTVEGSDRKTVVAHTRERILGAPAEWLSPGEDASFTSFDGTRTSARLYLPAPALGYTGPRPLVYYVHGGPQSQERPDFAWFSMPLIQYLTLNGFAVFVPNVRGSTGYGMSYAKQVDRDWGGQDRLDHVHALKVLAADERVDTTRAAVVGRSYGGYMTLTLAGRHPELWSAAVDMFGPYDLTTFMDRIPETWKPYFAIAVGDPNKPEDHAFLVERSPRTYIENLACPMIIIQGKNDPRVVERESRDLVEHLRGLGKDIEYLMFENEGHDVLKYDNRVTCYNAITEFFRKHLKP